MTIVIMAGMLTAPGCQSAAGIESSEELGRCAARVYPLSEAERVSITQGFHDQYGDAWQVQDIALFAGHVVRARLPVSPDDLGDPVDLDRDQAVARARDFLSQGAQLFGLTAGQVAMLEVVSAWQVPDAPVIQWNIGLDGSAPVPGYEELWPAVGQRFYLLVDIAKDGRVTMVVNRSDIMPQVDVCTDPGLEPGDPQLTSEVVGTELYYNDISGETRFAGEVQHSDIVATELDLYIDRAEEPSWITVHLAYRIDVALGLLTWSFYVDPDSGQILHIQQTFVT